MINFSRILRLATLGLASIALLQGIATAAESSRVYVNFKPGRKDLAKGLIQNASGVVHHEFDELNSVATTLPVTAIQALRNNPNIEFVEDDPPRYLFSGSQANEIIPYGLDMVQATAVWDANHDGVIDPGAATGTGIKVGVIDSGIFVGHEDFGGVTISGYNGNLPWNQDGSGHGTHVCGTIAASLNGKGVVGVSPGAIELYMVRVFGDSGTWAYSSTLLDAAQRCQKAGCKIISMSLGGSLKSRTEEQGLNALYNNGAGLLLIAAAGNDGTTRTSYPAGYASVVSVAAIDSTKTVADFSQKNSDVEVCAPGVGVLSTVPYTDTSAVTVGDATIKGTHIEFAAQGDASGTLVDGGIGDQIDPSWSDKIVLIQRGTLSFFDKVKNAQANGAVGVIIYNNVSGGFSGTLGDGNSSTIPAIGISLDDGNILKSKLGQVASLTSRILSNTSGYAEYDGTSMATPHVSAVAALVWSAVGNSKTAAQIRTALQVTAEDLGTAGRDTAYGYGLVRAKAAIGNLVGPGGGNNDTTPPVISNLTSRVVNAKQGTFEITWSTNEPATSQVTLNGQVYNNNVLVTSHKMSFRGTKGVLYTYTVTSTDAAGNTSAPITQTHKN
jgi:serine protease